MPTDTVAGARVIAITGGTGFLGTRLLRRLGTEGASVRMLTRRPVAQQARGGITVPIEGSVDDADALRRLVAGTDLVFHLAALAAPWARDRHQYHRTNVAGTQRLVDVCRSAAVGRLVHVSTNLVETHGHDELLLTEYQRTKRDAESVIESFVAAGGDAVVVRPTRIYGPGPLTQANAATRAIDFYRRGLLRVRLADGDARGNFVFVDDVVDGLLLAARHGSRGQAYALGGADATMREFFGIVGETTGRHRRMASIPLPLARAVAAVAELGGALGIQPSITPAWVNLLAIDWPTSSTRAVEELGYRPRSLHDGIRATVRWLEGGRPA